MPLTFTIKQAQARFAELINAAVNGNEVIITRRKVPVAKLVAVKSPMRRRPGTLRGKLAAAPDAFDHLSNEELKRWGI